MLSLMCGAPPLSPPITALSSGLMFYDGCGDVVDQVGPLLEAAGCYKRSAAEVGELLWSPDPLKVRPCITLSLCRASAPDVRDMALLSRSL